MVYKVAALKLPPQRPYYHTSRRMSKCWQRAPGAHQCRWARTKHGELCGLSQSANVLLSKACRTRGKQGWWEPSCAGPDMFTCVVKLDCCNPVCLGETVIVMERRIRSLCRRRLSYQFKYWLTSMQIGHLGGLVKSKYQTKVEYWGVASLHCV